MNDYKNFCEYVVRPEMTASVRLLRVFLITLYTLFIAVYSVGFWLILGLWTLMILLPFIMYAIIRITWKFTVIEYEYAIEAGELTVALIYNGAKRKVKVRASIPEMTLIAPYDAKSKHTLEKSDIDEVKYYIESKESERAYVCIYPDKKRGKKRAVVIETTPEALRILRLCNSTAFTASHR